MDVTLGLELRIPLTQNLPEQKSPKDIKRYLVPGPVPLQWRYSTDGSFYRRNRVGGLEGDISLR